MSLENIPDRTAKRAISKPLTIRKLCKGQIKPFGKIGVYRHRYPYQHTHHNKETICKTRVGGDAKKGIFPRKTQQKGERKNDTHRRVTHSNHPRRTPRTN